MFSKKQLIIISFVLAILFHFVFHFSLYGPPINIFKSYPKYLLALGSVLVMIFLYFGTYWRSDLKGSFIIRLYDLLIIWIFICFFRSLLKMNEANDLVPFLFSNYMGISLFPILFFVVGVSIRYFFIINKILSVYLILVTLVSFFLLGYFELQIFLLMPIFYLLLTIPLRKSAGWLFVVLVSVSLIVVSLTNRAGILRILISYSIVLVYYIMLNVKINRKLLNLVVFCILMVPIVSLYLGINGKSVFQTILGDDTQPYSQMNPYADTRTFLYFEVFQDLKFNNAFIFGKGLNAGYASEAFETYSRDMVEVGFLQILLKTGIVGFLLYISVVVSAIYKSLGKSKNLFMKSMGLLLASYVLMIFIENIIAYNILNVIIWIVVGMCHSEELRGLSNKQIKNLFRNSYSMDVFLK